MNLLSWLRGRHGDHTASGQKAMARPEPDRRFYGVGDLHGCIDQLDALFAEIEADRDGRDADIVFLGDYVDRGPDSRGVLERLKALQEARPDHIHCLLGNHDRMLLQFLGAPDPQAARWLEVGGQETLVSYGVLPGRGRNAEERLRETARLLASAMSPAVIDWLDARPLWWRSGNVVAVHALTDPRKPMEEQTEQTLLWARPGKRAEPRRDGHWVVHGHTVVEAPEIRDGRIAVDTGVCRGRMLSAVVLGEEAPRFLQVG